MRIYQNHAYICFMKARLNLTIEDNLLKRTKEFAEQQQTSVSELVEDYFREITKPLKRKNFVDLVKELGGHNIDANADLKNLYYQDTKHGL